MQCRVRQVDIGDQGLRTIERPAEVLGAGLILPVVTHIAPILVPLAAIGLALVMVGVAVFHAAMSGDHLGDDR
jgi:hypothetical protein